MENSQNKQKMQNITITLLLVTAAILLTAILTTYVNTGSSQAQAGGGAGVAGEEILPPRLPAKYVMGVGQVRQNQDFVYVIDVNAGRMNVYYTNLKAMAVDKAQGVEFGKLPNFGGGR